MWGNNSTIKYSRPFIPSWILPNESVCRDRKASIISFDLIIFWWAQLFTPNYANFWFPSLTSPVLFIIPTNAKKWQWESPRVWVINQWRKFYNKAKEGRNDGGLLFRLIHTQALYKKKSHPFEKSILFSTSCSSRKYNYTMHAKF